MSSCIVSGCKSGYRRKPNEPQNLHMFYPPKNDPALFAKWERLCCPKAEKRLTAKHRVCHKHFTDDMLLTQKEIPLADGTVYHYALELWRLKPGAFPCIFEGCGHPDWPEGSRRKAKPRSPPRKRKPDGASSPTPHLQPPSTAAAGTQTDICGNFCFPVEPVWDFAPKRPVLREHDAAQDGVFVPFDGLTDQQKVHVMSLARKAWAKAAQDGWKDHGYS